MSSQVQIVEVGPRDGFQNLSVYLPVEEKVKIIGSLVDAGVRHMEHTSFVSSKAIPQMRDAKEVTEILLEKYPDVDFFPLVPNLRGAQGAWNLGLKKVAYVVSMSASHNKANINRTHEESLGELKKIQDAYPEMEIILDLATAFGCPFEGKSRETGPVVDFLGSYAQAGVREVNLCDTIGIADPAQVRSVIEAVKQTYPAMDLQVHIHDTRGMGLVNTLAAIEAGVGKVQSTLGGLGGCPFAPGASGNLATEDLVYMLTEMGYQTGVDFPKILAAAKYEYSVVKGTFSGHHIHIEQTTTCS